MGVEGECVSVLVLTLIHLVTQWYIFWMIVYLSRPGMGELASLTLLNSVKFHTGADELASLTLFDSVKFRGHLRRFLILYGL